MVFESSFEDFFYILAGLIWVGFSIYKGTQKNKKTQNTDKEKSRGSSTLEKIFEEFLGEKQNDSVYSDENIDKEPTVELYTEPKTYVPQAESSSSNLFSYDDEYEEEGNFFEEKKVYTTEVEEKKEKPVSKNLRKPVKRVKKPRINIKKAVIYSTILNRPSY